MDHAGRLARVRDRLVRDGLPALLVTDRHNVRYLSGFAGSAGQLLVTTDDAVLITDGRYLRRAEEEFASSGIDVRVEASRRPAEVIERHTSSVERVGVEAAAVSWASARELKQALTAEVVPSADIVAELRSVKDVDEVDTMRQAVAIADAALAETVAAAGPTTTEAEFALDLEYAMRRRGASAVSFAPIVAAGPGAALPHACPGEVEFGSAAAVIVDFGCVLDGYCSDTTRTLAWGLPPEVITRAHEVVAAAQDAARAYVRAGVAVSEVDAAARGVIEEAGFGDAFVHSTGHGIGLEIHERPRLAAGSPEMLAAGNIVTLEPGIYLPDVGGVRIEDMVLVGEDGNTTFQTAPRVLLV